MSDTNSSDLALMMPYFHFTGGDHLFFKSWRPSSRGAIAGASIALVVLAVLERLLYATRGVMDGRWRRRALVSSTTNPAGNENGTSPSAKRSHNVRKGRTIPPFDLSRDSARGALYSLQALLAYVLMLAVMTFQAAYIISIIVGLGLGEVLFGRLAHAHL
ncbi:Ctr copper transporter [Russula dissimulans]|nr:Ctr copper transporter [Russula dissimulans]